MVTQYLEVYSGMNDKVQAEECQGRGSTVA